MFLNIFRFWYEICIWQKLSGKNVPQVVFLTKQQKYSKSDNFARVCAIINHNIFWCQKLSKTNPWMTLGLIFIIFFKNIILEHFSIFLYQIFVNFLETKKIQTQKWCIAEKFRPQKLGVTKGFLILKVVSDFDFNHFLEKWLQRHLGPNSSEKIQAFCQLSNVYRYQKYVPLVR